jgi:glycosyltransferase involved in cell wall biosynthesis
MDAPHVIVIVSAHNEADRLGDTLGALGDAFPGARILVADDASTDQTAAVATAAGAEVVTSPRNVGKGGATTLAAQRVLELAGRADGPVFVLCDGDLGDSASELHGLVAAVRGGTCDVAVGAFSARVGGGFGVAVGYARWAIRRLVGLRLSAPISGQRALRGDAFAAVVPFAPRFGMEIGMTVDAARAGFRVREIPLALAHRATGRTLAGFRHRGRQLADFLAVTVARWRSGRRA